VNPTIMPVLLAPKERYIFKKHNPRKITDNLRKNVCNLRKTARNLGKIFRNLRKSYFGSKICPHQKDSFHKKLSLYFFNSV
jgi:hypothetical protein